MNPVRLTPQQRFRLRRQLRTTDDLGTYRRTLGLLELDRGNAVTDVAVRLGVSRRTVHGWIDTYRHHPVPSSLVTHHSTGRPSDWTEDAQAILLASLDQPPDHFGYQATGWTVPLLQSHLAHWGLTGLSDATLRRQLHALGYVWKRPRYVLDPDPRRAAKIAGSANTSRSWDREMSSCSRTRPTSCCSRRCGPAGPGRGRRRGPLMRSQREARDFGASTPRAEHGCSWSGRSSGRETSKSSWD